MLPLPNGSEILKRSFRFTVSDSSHVGEVRRFIAQWSDLLNFSETRQGRIAIIANELTNNILKYAKQGEIILRVIHDNQTENPENFGIEILAIDSGPGMDNINMSLADGYSTGSTPGTGLGAVKRLADLFDIDSIKDKGTVVYATVFAKDFDRRLKPKFQIGAICIPIDSEYVCGDGWNVRFDDNTLSVIVADGLGHGPNAHDASVSAIEVFNRDTKHSEDYVMNTVHARLKSTRGAAVFLASVDSNKKEVSYCGVGNIRALTFEHGKTESLTSQNGTAGVQIKTVRTMQKKYNNRILLVLQSDGLNTRWDLRDYPGLQLRHPSVVAGTLYRDFDRNSDDSTVVVIGADHS